MKISSTIISRPQYLEANVETNGSAKKVGIDFKSNGCGSAVNGGEMLLLALATCFCNDLYREAARRNITLESVEVTATGDFAREGEAGKNFCYSAKVKSSSPPSEIEELIAHTDKVAEIQNTL